MPKFLGIICRGILFGKFVEEVGFIGTIMLCLLFVEFFGEISRTNLLGKIFWEKIWQQGDSGGKEIRAARKFVRPQNAFSEKISQQGHAGGEEIQASSKTIRAANKFGFRGNSCGEQI